MLKKERESLGDKREGGGVTGRILTLMSTNDVPGTFNTLAQYHSHPHL